MTRVEFRTAYTEDHDDDVFLDRHDLPAVPDVGELVNINGNPYRVIERAWALGNDSLVALHCYIRVR